jgi:hypothetical protein
MTRWKAPPARNAIAPTLELWVGLGAATGYLLWAVRVEPAGVEGIETALRLYASSLLTGLLVTAAVLACLRWLRMPPASLGMVSYASCVVYLGFGKALGWTVVPWALAAAAGVVMVLARTRRHVPAGPALPLLHTMGTVSGLYLFFHLREFLSAVPAFQDVLKALWLLIA